VRLLSGLSIHVRERLLTFGILPLEIRLCLSLGPVSMVTPFINLYRSSAELETISQIKLQSIINWVSQNNEFYRELWLQKESSFLMDLALEKLPIVTKSELREAESSGKIVSGGLQSTSNGFWISTSGSTGVPFRLWSLWSEYVLACWYSKRDLLMVSGIWKGLCCRGVWILWHGGHLKGWSLLFPGKVFVESEGYHIESISNYSPHYIYSPLSNAIGIASRLRDDPNLLTQWVPPRCLFTDSELSSKAQRKWISESIKAPVYDIYASEECFVLGAECKHENYHIPSDEVIIEIVDENGKIVAPGTVGRVIVTSLMRKSMPLIRYEIGDMAALGIEACPCGNPFPHLTEIHGRMNDLFVLPSGKEVSVYQLCAFTKVSLEIEKHVGRWQVVQVDMNNVEVRVTPRKCIEGSEEGLQKGAELAGGVLLKAVNKALLDANRNEPSNINISVIVSAELPLHPRGKRRNFVSNVR